MTRDRRSRFEEDNRIPLNPWAFVAAFGLVGGIAGLAVLLAVF